MMNLMNRSITVTLLMISSVAVSIALVTFVAVNHTNYLERQREPNKELVRVLSRY